MKINYILERYHRNNYHRYDFKSFILKKNSAFVLNDQYIIL